MREFNNNFFIVPQLLVIHGVVSGDAMNTQQTCYSLKSNMQLFYHSNLSKKFTIVVAFHKPLKV
jgi:hypothetical protein